MVLVVVGKDDRLLHESESLHLCFVGRFVDDFEVAAAKCVEAGKGKHFFVEFEDPVHVLHVVEVVECLAQPIDNKLVFRLLLALYVAIT